MTLPKKLKLLLIKKSIEWVIYDSEFIQNENKLSDVDKLIVLTELKKVENFEKMLVEFIDNSKNKYFQMPESNTDLRLMAKGLTGWAEFILKAMHEAPLKLKQIVSEQERNKNI